MSIDKESTPCRRVGMQMDAGAGRRSYAKIKRRQKTVKDRRRPSKTIREAVHPTLIILVLPIPIPIPILTQPNICQFSQSQKVRKVQKSQSRAEQSRDRIEMIRIRCMTTMRISILSSHTLEYTTPQGYSPTPMLSSQKLPLDRQANL